MNNSQNTNPKCPEHGKELDIIYPDNYKRLCRFRCGCIILKDKVHKPDKKKANSGKVLCKTSCKSEK